jgi:hypothetical protein
MILLTGPYIGSFEQEVITFRPYVKWLSEILEYDKMYISTHSNRAFMYGDMEAVVLPIFEDLSRDELSQVGYIHKSISQKDYQVILKTIKETIVEKEDCTKRDIEVYNLSYVKSTPPMSIYSKKFEPINATTINIEDYEGRVVFIPDRAATGSQLRIVRDYLRESYPDYIIIGDMRTRFARENVILNLVDYFENSWKYMVKIISKAKAVVCPLSYWTTICNLQSTPVFSWGEQVGQHKEDGVYHFGNRKCLAFPSTDSVVLIKMLDHFLGEL